MDKQHLEVLFLTDIHLQQDNLQKWFAWYDQASIRFDYVFVGGDTANCHHDQNTHDEQEMQTQANQVLISLVEKTKCPLLFVPGNHDPISHYDPANIIHHQVTNLHGKTVTLAKGLEIVGFGGSVPGYFDQQTTKQAWLGYPFQTNQALQEAWYKSNALKEAAEDSQKIFLTHVGPAVSPTSIDRRDANKTIYGGASYFNELYKRKDFLAQFHGHVHNGSHYDQIEGKPIINPGPLLYGQFMNFTLKLAKGQGWQIAQLTFRSL